MALRLLTVVMLLGLHNPGADASEASYARKHRRPKCVLGEGNCDENNTNAKQYPFSPTEKSNSDK